MNALEFEDVSSPADLGLAIYQKVQEITQGRARRAAEFLLQITCLELDGKMLPASPWCTLVLFSLHDLATHAPGAIIEIQDWAVHYHTMAKRSGEASAKEMAAALIWAGCLRRNIELRSDNLAVVEIQEMCATAA
jgi:hypothetical protein